MRLYDSVGPNPQVVRTFAAEKGITLTRVPVDIIAGENRTDSFRVRNPLGTTPALELDSGRVVSEITAICELLEELHPRPALIGNDAPERAETRMWVRRFDLAVVEPLSFGVRATRLRTLFESRVPLLSPEAGAEMLEIVNAALRRFDSMLAGRTHVCGERFSLADITLATFLLFARSLDVPLPDSLQWIPDWLDRMEARDSFRA